MSHTFRLLLINTFLLTLHNSLILVSLFFLLFLRKQIALLDEQYTTLQERFQVEKVEIKNYYDEKLEELKIQSKEKTETYEKELLNLKEEHENNIRSIRKSHKEDIAFLKEEQRTMLENVRQIKLAEFAISENSSTYVEKLMQSTQSLEDLNGNVQDLRSELLKKAENKNFEREKKLDLREKVLEDNERHLKILQQSSEEERKRLMNLVASLELQLQTYMKESNDKEWMLQEILATSKAEREYRELEKEHLRSQTDRDERRLKRMKQAQLQEIEKKRIELQEDYEEFAKEKIKFEQERQLMLDIKDSDTTDKLNMETLDRELNVIEEEDNLEADEEECGQSFRLAGGQEQKQLVRAKSERMNNELNMPNLQKRMQELNTLIANNTCKYEEQDYVQCDGVLYRVHMKNPKLKVVLNRTSVKKDDKVGKKSEDAVEIEVLRNKPKSQNMSKYFKYQGDIVDFMLDKNVAQVLQHMNSSTDA